MIMRGSSKIILTDRVLQNCCFFEVSDSSQIFVALQWSVNKITCGMNRGDSRLPQVLSKPIKYEL